MDEEQSTLCSRRVRCRLTEVDAKRPSEKEVMLGTLGVRVGAPQGQGLRDWRLLDVGCCWGRRSVTAGLTKEEPLLTMAIEKC